MKTRLGWHVLAVAAVVFLSGCAHTIQCKSSIANASYTGPYKGEDNNLTAEDMSRDIYCANHFIQTRGYKNRFVTIYGSSRLDEFGNVKDVKDEAIRKENAALYDDILRFSETWTRKYGSKYPIMTGAGPGIMEAGSRGAKIAGGPSIGYTTYYDPDPRGDASEAFWKYKGNEVLIDDGLIFSSVAIREYTMILHSAAFVIAPGGSGTEWEIFQILESTKSRQLKQAPIYLIGKRNPHWQSFYDRLDDMVKRGTIRQGEVTKHFTHVDSAMDIIPLLEASLKP